VKIGKLQWKETKNTCHITTIFYYHKELKKIIKQVIVLRLSRHRDKKKTEKSFLNTFHSYKDGGTN